MKPDDAVFVAGHKGMVGSALVRELEKQGFNRVVRRTRDELDLRNKAAVDEFFATEKPDYVFLAAAKVGGIAANSTYPADFLLENLEIQNNVISAAWRHGVKKLLFPGSSCIYPRLAPQPIPESSLLSGPLEPTNECYALAKIAGIKLCQALRQQYGCNFISAMPTNLYGSNDNYHAENSHVLPALIRRIHEAKISGAHSVSCWGSGTPRREFLHADDLARACIFLMRKYDDPEVINVGSGGDISISELTGLVKDAINFRGEILWDTSRPDGTPRKLLDSSRIFSMGWRPLVELRQGIERAYQDFLSGEWRGR